MQSFPTSKEEIPTQDGVVIMQGPHLEGERTVTMYEAALSSEREPNHPFCLTIVTGDQTVIFESTQKLFKLLCDEKRKESY